MRFLRQGPPPARSLRWMAHIIGAEELWLSRMEARPSELAVWPELTLKQCEARIQEVSRGLAKELTDDSGDLTRRVAYTNSKGEAWTSTVEEILTHIVIHSAYHRGQIASDMRTTGQEPAYTDFIHAARQGFIR